MKKITLTFIFISSIVFGQSYKVDNTFNPSDKGIYTQDIGANGQFLENGKILSLNNDFVSGFINKIFRLNIDGSLDNSFTIVTSNYSIDGLFANKVSGNFIISFVNQATNQTNLKSYDENGGLLATFTIPTFSSGTSSGRINKVVFLNDGKLLILGNFTLVNGVSIKNMVRLNPNGSIDNSFNIGTGFSNQTTAVALQTDGKYVVGGDFTSFNGVSKGKIVRLTDTGALDPTFDVQTVYNSFGLAKGFGYGPITDIIFEPNGKIITAGASYFSGGTTYRKTVIRFNSDGSVDSSFLLSYITDNYPGKLLYSTDGSIYFNIDGKLRKCNNSGATITSFNNLNIEGNNNAFNDNDIIFQNNKIATATNYKNASGITRLGYHRLNPDGSLDITFNPNFGPNVQYNNQKYASPIVRSIVMPDNKILLYGDSQYCFSSYNDVSVKSIIRLTENGELDTSFKLDPKLNSSMIDHPLKAPIRVNEIFDGKIYIKMGYGTVYKLNNDGSIDKTLDIPQETSQFTITRENKIIGIGPATSYKNGNLFKVVRYNSDSTIDNTFNSSLFGYQPISFEILEDNKIIVSFGQNFIILLNENGSFNNKYDTDNYIYSTKTINGKIYLLSDNYIKRLNSDYSKDSNFTTIQAKSFLPLSNERTLTTANKSNPSNEKMFQINNSSGNEISTFLMPLTNTIASQNCENIILSGSFNSIIGTIRHNICRLSVPNSTITPTPTGAINQSFTQGQTLADLIVNGQNIQWYSAQNDCTSNRNTYRNSNINQINSILPSSTVLASGTTYFASQTINGVENNHRLPVTVSLQLGVNEFNLVDLKLFPNPIKESLTISNSTIIDKIEIYNLIGQKIIEKDFFAKNVKIDFNNYLSGLYIIKTFSEGKIQTNKIVKE